MRTIRSAFKRAAEKNNTGSKSLRAARRLRIWVRRIAKVLFLMLFFIVLVNLVEPFFCKLPDQSYMEEIMRTEYEADSCGCEKILCIDDNEEALRWRLRMIGSAQESVVLATFDLRTDNSGTDILAAIYDAAERGVKVKLLIDGIYQPVFLDRNAVFEAIAAHENVEVGIYNPIAVKNILRLNYRMHDKYLIVDERMYLLGGRNTNDIFLGDRKTGINIDRDILVYDTSGGNGESLLELQEYFREIWKEDCVEIKKVSRGAAFYESQYELLRERFDELKERYQNLENFNGWDESTFEADKITLLTNGTHPGRKNPRVLQAIGYLAQKGSSVIIQTPYVICNQYMYGVLEEIAGKAKLQIVLNAVEKGSNPWGCTDYLNHKQDILKTGADVYELLNEHAVHTKTVLIDQNLSVVGSYNLDMRSTYLDTELMLVIDSEELNRHIRKTEEEYMEKSKEVLSGGRQTEGRLYEKKELTQNKKTFYSILRIIIRPLRHLL